MEIQPTHSINQVVNGADTDQAAYKKICRSFDETKSSLVSLSQYSQKEFTSMVWDIVTWPYQMLLKLWDWLFGAKKEEELLGGKKKCTATSCYGDHGSCCGGVSVSSGGGGLLRTKRVTFDLSLARVRKPDSKDGVRGSLARRGTDVNLSLQHPVDPEEALRALLKERGVTEEEFRAVLATVNKTFAEVARAYFTDHDEPSLAYITWVIQNIEVERLRAKPSDDDMESQGTDELEEVQDEELLSKKRSDAAQQALRVHLQQQNIDEAGFTRLIRGSTFADVAMAWHTKKIEGIRVVQGIILKYANKRQGLSSKRIWLFVLICEIRILMKLILNSCSKGLVFLLLLWNGMQSKKMA